MHTRQLLAQIQPLRICHSPPLGGPGCEAENWFSRFKPISRDHVTFQPCPSHKCMNRNENDPPPLIFPQNLAIFRGESSPSPSIPWSPLPPFGPPPTPPGAPRPWPRSAPAPPGGTAPASPPCAARRGRRESRPRRRQRPPHRCLGTRRWGGWEKNGSRIVLQQKMHIVFSIPYDILEERLGQKSPLHISVSIQYIIIY